jgi:hypothetical protein
MGAINTEIEWRYFFPTIVSHSFDNGPANDGDIALRPTQFPGACGVWSNSGDCKIHLGIPHSGDELQVRGRIVRDCGHVKVTGPAEVHPFTGMMWLHPLSNDFGGGADYASQGVVWLRLMSHEVNPVQNFTPAGSTQQSFAAQGSTGAMMGQFHIPGYPSPTGETLYIGPVKSDWVLDPNHGVAAAPVLGCDCHGFPESVFNEWICNQPSGGWINSAHQPATAPDDMNNHRATDIFSITAEDMNTGFIRVTASFNGLPPGETDTNSDLPFIVGAHMEVCYPACDASGCQTNNCPGMCRNAASCVGKYTTNFDVDALPLAVTYQNDVTLGVAKTMPGVNIDGRAVGSLDVWANANPAAAPALDSFRMELFGLRPYFGNGNWGQQCSAPYAPDVSEQQRWADGTQVKYGFDCGRYNTTWRYNALTGQISIARTTPNAQPDSPAKCLDARSVPVTLGTDIIINRCDPNSLTQKWTIDQGNSLIPQTQTGLINRIRNVGGGFCLAEKNGENFLYLEDCSSTASAVNLSWAAS